MRKNLSSAIGCLLASFALCLSAAADEAPAKVSTGTNAVATTVHPLKAAGLDNFFQLTDNIYSGAAPEGDAAFAELQKLGIKTIITVDGSKPDVERAHRYGMKYVHLPIGYDGVPAQQALRLVKAAETVPGPIYVHCHHGMHRGPAGAAVICMATAGWTPAQADAWLHLAGTATNYAGLYKTVDDFHVPTPETLKTVSGDFQEKTDVSPLAEVMIQVDERFDNLKLIKKASYHAPAQHPDLDPAQEALLLDELFKELLRSPMTDQEPLDFRAKLADAESAVSAFRTALNSPLDLAKADAAYERVNKSCAACHKDYRNKK